MSVIFDTLAYARELTSAGIPPQQAEAHARALARAMDEGVATKSDIKELERKLDELEHRLTIRLGGMNAASIAIVAALVRLL